MESERKMEKLKFMDQVIDELISNNNAVKEIAQRIDVILERMGYAMEGTGSTAIEKDPDNHIIGKVEYQQKMMKENLSRLYLTIDRLSELM